MVLRNLLSLLFLSLPFLMLAQEEHKQFNILIEEDGDAFKVEYEERTLNKKYKTDQQRLTASVDTFLSWIYLDQQSFEDKSEILLHIHGMWGGRRPNFNKAYKLMHEFYVQHEYSDIAHIVSIKWPGNRFEYALNKETIHKIKQESKDMLLTFMKKYYLYQYFFKRSNTRMDLIAHSLGNQFLEQMYTLFDEDEKSAIWFDQIVLAASDNVHNVFDKDQNFEDLPIIANGVHVYYSERDVTLGISNRLNKVNRIGQAGPTLEQNNYDNLYFVDVTAIRDEINISDLMTGHAYYRASPDVTYDILYSLMSMKNLKRLQSPEREQFFVLQ